MTTTTTLRRRVDTIAARDAGLAVAWACPECGLEVLHYRWGEPCAEHRLAPPARPGERRIVVEQLAEGGRADFEP